jgi:hypothetical protein
MNHENYLVTFLYKPWFCKIKKCTKLYSAQGGLTNKVAEAVIINSLLKRYSSAEILSIEKQITN